MTAILRAFVVCFLAVIASGRFHLSSGDRNGDTDPNLIEPVTEKMGQSTSPQKGRITYDDLDSGRWPLALSQRTFVIFDRQYFHDEVHGPLLDCLGQFENTKIIVYRQDWRWRFGQLLRGSYPLRSPKNLVRDLQHDPALAGPIDLIFGTCDLDLVWMSDDLDAIWRARAAENRFRIVCIRHWPGEDLVRDNAHWLDRAAFTVLGGSKSKKLKTMLTGLDRFGRSHDSLDAGASAIPGRTTGPTLVAPSE